MPWWNFLKQKICQTCPIYIGSLPVMAVCKIHVESWPLPSGPGVCPASMGVSHSRCTLGSVSILVHVSTLLPGPGYIMFHADILLAHQVVMSDSVSYMYQECCVHMPWWCCVHMLWVLCIHAMSCVHMLWLLCTHAMTVVYTCPDSVGNSKDLFCLCCLQLCPYKWPYFCSGCGPHWPLLLCFCLQTDLPSSSTTGLQSKGSML